MNINGIYKFANISLFGVFDFHMVQVNILGDNNAIVIL